MIKRTEINGEKSKFRAKKIFLEKKFTKTDKKILTLTERFLPKEKRDKKNEKEGKEKGRIKTDCYLRKRRNRKVYNDTEFNCGTRGTRKESNGCRL